jgi:tetratricopeptide (TPR) repeat protein
MNEMLGNQYFMARNYLGAANAFQEVLKEDPSNIIARKKLIIAFTQIGKYTQAVDLFTKFISENIDRILETDPIKDDCPCPELVHNLEHLSTHGSESFTTYETLGILWLYCDINKSIEYFKKALALKPKDDNVNGILILLNKKLSENTKKNRIQYPS